MEKGKKDNGVGQERGCKNVEYSRGITEVSRKTRENSKRGGLKGQRRGEVHATETHQYKRRGRGWGEYLHTTGRPVGEKVPIEKKTWNNRRAGRTMDNYRREVRGGVSLKGLPYPQELGGWFLPGGSSEATQRKGFEGKTVSERNSQ